MPVVTWNLRPAISWISRAQESGSVRYKTKRKANRQLHYIEKEGGSAVLLGHSQDLLDRGDAGACLGPAVITQGDHATLDGMAANLARWPLGKNEAARLFGDHEELVDADTPAVARAAAVLAAFAAEELHAGGVGDADGEKITRLRLVGRAAGGADAADEALGQHTVQHRRNEIRLPRHLTGAGG